MEMLGGYPKLRESFVFEDLTVTILKNRICGCKSSWWFRIRTGRMRKKRTDLSKAKQAFKYKSVSAQRQQGADTFLLRSVKPGI